MKSLQVVVLQSMAPFRLVCSSTSPYVYCTCFAQTWGNIIEVRQAAVFRAKEKWQMKPQIISRSHKTRKQMNAEVYFENNWPEKVLEQIVDVNSSDEVFGSFRHHSSPPEEDASPSPPR